MSVCFSSIIIFTFIKLHTVAEVQAKLIRSWESSPFRGSKGLIPCFTCKVKYQYVILGNVLRLTIEISYDITLEIDLYNIRSNPSKPGTKYCWHVNRLHPIWKIAIASISNNTTKGMSRKRTKLFLQNILNPKVARMTDTAEADEYQKTIIAGLSSSKCSPLVFMQVLVFITFIIILIIVIEINL